MRLFFCLIFFALFQTGCKPKPIDKKEEGQKLMQLSREWSRLAGTDSLEKVLAYWADDAVVMPPGQTPVKGKAAIRQMVEGTAHIPGFQISWEPQSVYISNSGDLAYMIEQNHISFVDSGGATHHEYNKAVTVWRKDADGNWKNVVDMWNALPAQK